MTVEDVAAQPDTKTTRSTVSWMLASVVWMVFWTVVATSLPAPMKRLGLFALAYGAIAGAVMCWLLVQFSASVEKWTWVFVLSLLIPGEVLLVVGNYQFVYLKEMEGPLFTEEELVLAKMFEGVKDEQGKDLDKSFLNPLTARQKEREQQKLFRSFLIRRVSPLGDWSFLLALTFWIGEILFGSVLGLFLFHQLAKSTPTVEDGES